MIKYNNLTVLLNEPKSAEYPSLYKNSGVGQFQNHQALVFRTPVPMILGNKHYKHPANTYN